MTSIPPQLDSRAKRSRLDDFERRCREYCVPVTTQRRVVLPAVLDLDGHPAADQVSSSPAVRRARISRETGYRTLDSLVRLGAIAKARHKGGVVRCDGRIAVRHHLVCLRCEAVPDIADERLDALPVSDPSRFVFEIGGFPVQLHGLCRSCRRQEERQ